MHGGLDEIPDLDRATELLGDFTSQRRFGALADLDLPARELPKAGKHLFGTPARSQHPTVGDDGRSDHANPPALVDHRVSVSAFDLLRWLIAR
ncbi:hypothetical protein MICRO8M_60014 [Microbacterium sp. 8M]|nr:hypothetical protein MICRO8M_60014 [Microbacterium sp. 8M]